jgi:hypothetical protein
MWGVLSAIVLGGYAVGYTVAVGRRGDPWLPNVRSVNRFVALLIVALGLLVHTPVLDPVGWSARNQVARLIDGRIPAGEFDYGYLNFKLGRQGREKLDALEELESHQDLEAIRNGVIAARGADNYWGWKEQQGPTLSPELFEVFPAGTKLPDGLLAVARGQIQRHIGSACRQAKTCSAFRADLDAQAPEEWILVVGRNFYNQPYVFSENGESFEFLGRLHREGEAPALQDFKDHLRASRVRSLAPRYRDLEIGETRYRLVPK